MTLADAVDRTFLQAADLLLRSFSLATQTLHQPFDFLGAFLVLVGCVRVLICQVGSVQRVDQIPCLTAWSRASLLFFVAFSAAWIAVYIPCRSFAAKL
jgi:hypothetical protein